MGAWRLATLTLIGLIWGSEWLILRDVDISPLHALAWRCSVAALMLAAISAILRIRFPRRRYVGIAALTGVTMMALPAGLTVWAGVHITLGLLVVILSMTPLIASLIEGRASGTVLTPLIGGVGATAILVSQGLSFAAAQLPGIAAVLTAATLIAGSVVIVKRELSGVHPVMMSGIQFVFAAAVLAPLAQLVEDHASYFPAGHSLAVEFLTAIFGSVLAFPLYYWLLRHLQSYQVTSSQWVVTLVGVAEGLILLHETPTWRAVAGMALMAASLAVLWRNKPGGDTPLTIQIMPASTEG
ncbi:Permease of the drug/metabolite transporter (DMT) superfamily [Acidisarcina polymorpha]|uniref:Permease of the drug/metabolite transporter (DMT) superfamily n=1 Tax=Acidisarcina polymorpha TaxID=2211140 RepID=A0A2Z5G9Q9_9BACT|nr:DMT family transporter [Acidisarcina polymorpha]AXC15891.1 Permease of the drug/metabolite transporter (DMT) superfamily [Acidisarcina polymorpha]